MGRDSGQPPSQSELARRLTADGFPVPQSHISRMQDAVLPAAGDPKPAVWRAGRHQVERLAVLPARACERTWERRALGRSLPVDFATLFQDVLAVRHAARQLLAAAGAG